MEYNREYWQPRIATNPNRFRKLNESNDYVELINEPEAITQAGTAFTAPRLNNMESGITGAVAGVNEIQGVVDFTTAVNTFSGLSQAPRNWQGMTTLGTDVYACVAYDGDIYKQTGGTGDFIALGQTIRNWSGMTTLGPDVYACVDNGDIYKQTNGTGDFIALGQTIRNWFGMTTLGSDVYACVAYGGDIYKQTNGTGDFIALGQAPRLWYGMTTLGSDVYACVAGGDIYKQTNGAGDFIALGQTQRQWSGMTTLGPDVYACVYNGDIYKQTNGTGDFIALGQAPRLWYGMTTLGSDVYACVDNGDIYTATILTGNTFRASSSFTLPAMPDGARKRILNTHATTAITVTAYAGTTIEGQATMTLSAGHEVELELIGTDWQKTGWNEKSLASFVSPVDCSSRVAEYTGDGIPLIPDNVAGRTYFQDAWATTDGWTSTTGSLSVSGGSLMFTASVGGSDIYKPAVTGLANGQYITLIITSSINTTISIRVGTYQNTIKTVEVIAGIKTQITSLIPVVSGSGVWLVASGGLPNLVIDTIYIGTGAYDTPALDRAGNGNSLSLNAVTPVNGKYGKEMSFNGSTSFAQASSPVIGTTGTIAVRFKRGTLGTIQWLFSTTNAVSNGFEFYFNTSNVLRFVFSNGTTQVGLGTKVFDSTSTYASVIVNSSGQVFYDGVLSTDTVPTSWVIGLRNLLLGTNTTAFFNGIISHFRYDSRIWTADEARAWSLNPISIDSRV